MKVVLGVVVLGGVTVGAAIIMVIWISGLTPIHVTEAESLSSPPPTPEELVDLGAVLLVHGEIDSVHEPEWNTADGTRPRTPWNVSSVPDDFWIQTPVTVQLSDPAITLSQDTAGDTETSELTFIVRGGELDRDLYEIDDGQDRDFEPGEEVLLVLAATDEDNSYDSPWSLMRKYSLQPDGTAVLVWDEDEYEQPVGELIDEFEEASQ